MDVGGLGLVVGRFGSGYGFLVFAANQVSWGGGKNEFARVGMFGVGNWGR